MDNMQDPLSLLRRIHDPADLKKLNLNDLASLAAEIREFIVASVSLNGGHLASNLGVVELAIALHWVFHSPQDAIIWDVGHQCYAHKLLTGRMEGFSRLRKHGGLAGFPERSESPHDVFNTGHASTSISAALGILAGDRIAGGRSRPVAVIGDGALTGGLAYEALSHAGQLGLPLVVILNDNKMSIGPNVGGLSKYLSRLSLKGKYQLFRRTFDAMIKKIPGVGDLVFDVIVRLKRAVKAVFYTDNFFVDLGFEYVGPIEGHRIQRLIEVFEDARKLERPVVIHVITRKGKGYGFAEEDPGSYHGVGSFSVAGGIAARGAGPRTFTEAFGRTLLEAAARDPKVVAITAAMEKGTGLSDFKKSFPKRFFDVGIAEEHAVTFAAGLASRGLKPVLAVYSTFMQRAVDQVIHDVALQKLPVIFMLDRGGFVGEDGKTHQGLYDIALFRSVPDLILLAPATAGELSVMLNWALDRVSLPGEFSGPVMIRYPKAESSQAGSGTDNSARTGGPFEQPLEAGRGIIFPASLRTDRGGCQASVCLAFTGSLFGECLKAAGILEGRGIGVDLYNPRFLKPVDEDYLADLLNRYERVVFCEEGMRAGGFGEYVAALALGRRCSASVKILAVDGGFSALGSREELLRLNGLDGESIAGAVLAEKKGNTNEAALRS
jgi:1-deoxy-D-xylulose-5-phosphate synthase